MITKEFVEKVIAQWHKREENDSDILMCLEELLKRMDEF